MKKMLVVFVVLAGLALPSAKADTIIPGMTGVLQYTTGAKSGQYIYFYDFALTTLDKLTSITPFAEWVTLYDFKGMTGAGSTEASWSTSIQAIGVTPSATSPTDGLASNVTWTYVGGVNIFGSSDPSVSTFHGCATPGAGVFNGETVIAPFGGGTGPACFWVESTLPPGGLIEFSGQNTKDHAGFPDDGSIAKGIGTDVGPVPEPTSWLLLGAGLLGLVGFSRRNRKS